MSYVQIVLGCLVFAALLIPIVQLAFGFHYVGSPTLCPLQPDIMLLMAIGGVFEAIFFAATIGLICTVIPRPPKKAKKNEKSVAQASAEGSNRASKILFGRRRSFFFSSSSVLFAQRSIAHLQLVSPVYLASAPLSSSCSSTCESWAIWAPSNRRTAVRRRTACPRSSPVRSA